MLANFSPGPSPLPEAVRSRIAAELNDWRGTGTSVMELSHRGAEFMALAAESEARFRALAGIADRTRVLFLQGGASSQFALVPLNLRSRGRCALYASDGHWGRKALAEGKRLRRCRGLSRGELVGQDADYEHLTSNETVDGLQWLDVPVGDNLRVCDLSSDICSRPMRLEDFDIAYAGAQKNLGIAGLTVVLLSERGHDACRDDLPTLQSYRALAASESMANTPPTFAWYVFDLVLQWIEGLGGLQAVARRNRSKCDLLYNMIDRSAFYRARVAPERRSLVNVVFETPSPDDDARFATEAAAAGLIGLKGHRAVGGLRASLYNAVEPRSVEALVSFMREFERCA